jgi:hypothetical protein
LGYGASLLFGNTYRFSFGMSVQFQMNKFFATVKHMRKTVVILLTNAVLLFGLSFFITTNSDARSSSEYAAILTAPKYYLDPDKLFQYGHDIGLAQNCKLLNKSKINVAQSNLERWIKVASTDFEPINSQGVFNKRLFKKAMLIVSKGIELGAKEGRMIKNTKSFKNEFCSKILNTFDAPPGELGK